MVYSLYVFDNLYS